MSARISMTKKQRDTLLALPDTEDAVMRWHSLTDDDLAAIAASRTPETRLGYALQLCCLRYPGRNLRRGEVLPAIRQRHGFRPFTSLVREEFVAWATQQAIGLSDVRILLDRLIERMRAERVVIPGISVVERLAASAMNTADTEVIEQISSHLSDVQRLALDALLSDKTHVRQSRLAWLRQPPSRVGGQPLLELLDKLDLIASVVGDADVQPTEFTPPMLQMARVRVARSGAITSDELLHQRQSRRRIHHTRSWAAPSIVTC